MKHRPLKARNFQSAGQDAAKAKPSKLYDGPGSAYHLAFTDLDFLLQEELRPVRIQLELMKPEMVQAKHGIESTIVATAKLPGWMVYATDVELFEDFQDPQQPSVEWRNTVTLRLTRSLSLNYYLNLDHVPLVVDTLQTDQSLLLRASWALL